MKIKLCLLASVACLLPFAATAADLPVQAPPKTAVTPFTWTGFYIGAAIGGGSESVTGTDQAPSLILDNPGTQYGVSGSGGVFGGYVGYNFQWGVLVYGIEADLAYSTITGTITVPAEANGTGTVSAMLDYLGTVRGRIGYAFDYLLIYATGGFAYLRAHQRLG